MFFFHSRYFVLFSIDINVMYFLFSFILFPCDFSAYLVGNNAEIFAFQKESEKTKGPGWFNMKAPELTEEAKRDLEVLQMRSVLDPKRHYKNDMKVRCPVRDCLQVVNVKAVSH